MRKSEKEALQAMLDDEQETIKALEKAYQRALRRIDNHIRILESDEMTQSKIYQKRYQEAMKAQINAALDELHKKSNQTIEEYLTRSYQHGYVGTMYSLHKQGMPILAPIDQRAVTRAVRTDSKLSGRLYGELGVDMQKLKKTIRREISIGISIGSDYNMIARQVQISSGIPLKRAKTIVRTEGHRIQQQSADDARNAAKGQGCQVVKQWDAVLDGNTRTDHRILDGQIREVGEPFEIDGKKAEYPGAFGRPEEDCNCRCVALTRARWGLDEAELQTMKDRAKFFGLDKTENFKEFEEKYLNAADTLKKQGESGIIGVRSSAAPTAQISQIYVDAVNSGSKVLKVGGADCAISEQDYGFSDGTTNGVKKNSKATVYTLQDGTRFVFPKSYDKKKQTLSPNIAISTWNRVPDNLRRKIQKVVEVVDYYNPQDAIWRKRYKNFTHSYAVGGDTITFFRSNYHDLDYLAATYCHEGGHYIDYTLPGTNRANRYSIQLDWQNAMADDLKASGMKSWRAYGENSPLEDFADSVAYYTLEHDKFAKLFPNRTRLLDTILK